MKNIKKIAILRANALGDFLVTLPAIDAIRAAYPNAEIVLLGKPWHKEFLIKGRCVIDRVIVVPPLKGIRDEKVMEENEDEQKAFFSKIRKEHFDIAVHFQGNGYSANSFLNRLKAGLTVGLTSHGAEKLDRSIDYYYYQSEVMRFLEVASLIGAKTVSFEPHINILPADKEEAKGLLSFLNNKPFVVLHPFAMDARRAWPASNYIALGDWLKEKKFEVVFTGSKEDFSETEEIISKMKHKAINACGTTGLGGLAAILKKASLVIGGDTGPIHLARAVNTPTVGIYWAPNLINWGPLTRSIHRPVVSWNMNCPFCGTIPNDPYPFEPQNGCEHRVSFVRDIPVEEVIEAAESLLFRKEERNFFSRFSFQQF
ncbi:MAG: glycosyltransferase family 9 protein [Ginsengibacter sp.]